MRRTFACFAVAFVAACDGSAAPSSPQTSGTPSAADPGATAGVTPDPGAGGTTRPPANGSDCPLQVTRLAYDANLPGPLAVDASWLYWAEQRGDHASIVRMPKAGGPSSVVTSDDLDASAASYGIAGLAVDGDGIYWSSYSYPSGDAIGRSMLLAYHFADGGTVALAVAAVPIRDLLVDDGAVIYSNADGLWSIPTGGGTPYRIAALPGGKLTIDAWHIFLAASGTLYRIDRQTGAVETLASGFSDNIAVAVDFNDAYVADAHGQLFIIDAPGDKGFLYQQTPGLSTVVPWIRRAGAQLYWSGQDRALMRIATDATSVSHFLGATPTATVIDGDRLYYSQNDEVDVVCR